MTDITRNLVKGSKRFASKSKKVIEKGIDSGEKLLSSLGKGKMNLELPESLQQVKKNMDGVLDNYTKNTQLNVIVKIIIALYAAFVVPHLSGAIVSVMDNILVKVMMAVLVVYISSKDISLAILLALAYILTIQQKNTSLNQNDTVSNNEYFKDDSCDSSKGIKDHSFQSIESVKDNRFIEQEIPKEEPLQSNPHDVIPFANNKQLHSLSEEEHHHHKGNSLIQDLESGFHTLENKLGLNTHTTQHDPHHSETPHTEMSNSHHHGGHPQVKHLEKNDDVSQCHLDGSENPFEKHNYGLWESVQGHHDTIVSGSDCPDALTKHKSCDNEVLPDPYDTKEYSMV